VKQEQGLVLIPLSAIAPASPKAPTVVALPPASMQLLGLLGFTTL